MLRPSPLYSCKTLRYKEKVLEKTFNFGVISYPRREYVFVVDSSVTESAFERFGVSLDSLIMGGFSSKFNADVSGIQAAIILARSNAIFSDVEAAVANSQNAMGAAAAQPCEVTETTSLMRERRLAAAYQRGKICGVLSEWW